MSLAIWGILQMMSPFYTLQPETPAPEAQTAARPLRRPVLLSLASTRVAKPLRVARVQDDLSHPDSAGRMVMSGRMDEVCAELDRLVQLEAWRNAQNQATNEHATALAA